MHLTRLVPVANCISPVTLVLSLQPADPRLPRVVAERLAKAGWSRELEARGVIAGGPAVAIVGARAASKQAMERAHALAQHCAEHGVHVVSGGAIGIDGAAHRGALAGGGATTVVLGSGIDVAYPTRHAPMFEDIVARGGAIISMFPRGTEPRRETFPQRNHLIAALADVVVVVEADLKSGSLSTARAARELARMLAACPGSPGCERLLATGAAMVEHGEDVLGALAGRVRPRAQAAPRDPISAQIVAALASGARGVDAIVAHTNLPVRDVLRALPMINVEAVPEPGEELGTP
jgi:DNA processing protein